MSPTEHQPGTSPLEFLTEVETTLRKAIENFEDPQVGAKNIQHFKFKDGSFLVKSVPWINAEGIQTEEKPPWIVSFQSTETEMADYIANMPDPEPETEPGVKAVRNLKNPITGAVVTKKVPWINGGIVLDQYRSGLEISQGAKVAYEHNPNTQFDKPGDLDNLRFLDSNRVMFAANSFEEISYYQQYPMRTPREGIPDTVFVGINLGGTIMMRNGAEGLVPDGQIGQTFDTHFQKRFPRTRVKSFSFPRTKLSKDSQPSYGIDSSQIEMDFIADIANSMICIWNDLKPEERKVFGGFLICTGTDTAVEALSYLKMMLGPDCPFSVIAVGAMKPLEEEGSEGTNSFLKAIEELSELKKNQVTAFGFRAEGGLYDPTKSVKVSNKIAAAFKGAKILDTDNFDTVESATKDGKFRKKTESDLTSEYQGALLLRGPSQILSIGSEISPNLFELERMVRNSGSKAILIETLASFTKPLNAIEAIKRGAKGRPVFCVNPLSEGAINDDYQAAKELLKRGVFPITVTTHAARAKLNYAIQLFGADHQKIIDFMTKNNFVDEQPDGFTPYSEDQINETKVLLRKLLDLKGITPEAVEQFESEEFRLKITRWGIRNAIGKAYSTKDPQESELKEQYAYYNALKGLATEQLIELVKTDEDLASALLPNNKELAANIIELSTISTVRLKGQPIELKEIPLAA